MPSTQSTEEVVDRTEHLVERIGHRLVRGFQLLGLFVIGGTIVWAAGLDYLQMIQAGRATLHDILLLFIYLELGAMVGVYFRTNELPVEFLIFVAITVITRTMVEVQGLSDTRLMVLTVSVLVLSGSVVLLYFGARRFRGTGEGGSVDIADLPGGGRRE